TRLRSGPHWRHCPAQSGAGARTGEPARFAVGSTGPWFCPTGVELACRETCDWLRVSRPLAGGWSDVLASGASGSLWLAHPLAADIPAPGALPLPAAPWPASRLASAFPIARLFGPPAARTLECAGAAARCAVAAAVSGKPRRPARALRPACKTRYRLGDGPPTATTVHTSGLPS